MYLTREQIELGKAKQELLKKAVFCAYCGLKLSRERKFKHNNNPMYPTLDHKVPKDMGGEDKMHNIIVACVRCNRMKANDSFADFLDHIITLYKNLTNS